MTAFGCLAAWMARGSAAATCCWTECAIEAESAGFAMLIPYVARVNLVGPAHGRSIAAAVLCLLVLAVGCDGSTTPPDATGQYAGTFVYKVDDEAFEETWGFAISEVAGGRIQGAGAQGDDGCWVL